MGMYSITNSNRPDGSDMHLYFKSRMPWLIVEENNTIVKKMNKKGVKRLPL